MREILFRCSAIGKLMTEPMQIDARLRTPEVDEIIAKKKRTDEEKALIEQLKRRTLSATAKTHVRQLVAQDLFGVDFEVTSKHMEKGIEVEAESIKVLNRVRGLSLVKNTERRTDGFLTGECDIFDAPANQGRDLKSSWSLQTFPILVEDCQDQLYEWQMRGYMRLWDAASWSVDYVMVNTPDRLIGYESQALHFVDHIPEHHRITSWVVERDLAKEALMLEKVQMARAYYAEVVAEFDRIHRATVQVPAEAPVAEPAAPPEAPESPPAPTPAPPPIAQPMASSRPAAAPSAATMKLGDLNARLAPIQITADGLAQLGFQPVGTERAAKLYREADFDSICLALVKHIHLVKLGATA